MKTSQAIADQDHGARSRGTPSGPPAVEAQGLGKRYGDFWALHQLDLGVPAGSVLGLLGHNGAGTHAVAFSRDGQTLAAACADGTVALWDMTGKPPALRATLKEIGRAHV